MMGGENQTAWRSICIANLQSRFSRVAAHASATTSLPNPAIRDGKPVLTIKMNVIWNQEAAQFQEQRSPPVPRPAPPAPAIGAPVLRLSRHPLWRQDLPAIPLHVRLLPQEKPSLPPCISSSLTLVSALSDQTPSNFSGTQVQSQDPGSGFCLLQQQYALLGLVQGKAYLLFGLAGYK